jgi:beta-galactosidase
MFRSPHAASPAPGFLAPAFMFLAIAVPSPVRAQQAAVPPPPPLMIGAAWYPEQWPESRWEADLTLMEQAHLHVVRVGEFAWSSFEPTEGVYKLDWMERAINLAGKHGIYTVLGTPTATPPAWLTQKYPETLRIENNGQRDQHGNRLQYDFTSPKYRELSRDIVRRLAQRFGHNPYVIGWQLDNEISTTSIDDYTKKLFQDWLRARYSSLDNLNARWTTSYWSQTYTDWSQIPIPIHDDHETGNPGLLLCWRLFVSDTWRSYLLNQIDVIRPLADKRQFITTNTMGFFDAYDHYVTESVLDLAAWDNYIRAGAIDPVENGLAHDLARGFKRKNFWVMETQPAFVNWKPINVALQPGAVRALVWHDIAHGADAVSFWQWRSGSMGRSSTTVPCLEPTARRFPSTPKCSAPRPKSTASVPFSQALRRTPMSPCFTATRVAGPSSGSAIPSSSIRLPRWSAITVRCGAPLSPSTSSRPTPISRSTSSSSRPRLTSSPLPRPPTSRSTFSAAATSSSPPGRR